MKQREAATLLVACLVASAVTTSSAWFVAYEEEPPSSTADSPLPTSASATIASPPGVRKKVLEASEQHRELLLQGLQRRPPPTGASKPSEPDAAPGQAKPIEITEPDQPDTTDPSATKDFWDEGDLPKWLPTRVRQEFLRDNSDFLLRRSSQNAATSPPVAPTAVHETKNYWNESDLPSWLPAQVKKEFARDNKQYLRMRGLLPTSASIADPVVETRNYWKDSDLPSWLPPRVRSEFSSDNNQYLRMRGLLRTPAPTPEHVTRDVWNDLPSWLPNTVRQEFIKDNPAAAAAAPTEATLPPWLVDLLRRSNSDATGSTVPIAQSTVPSLPRLRLEKSDGYRSRSLSNGSNQVAAGLTTAAITTPAPTAPTRSPLTLSSADGIPPKCSRQVNWLDQPKCSSSRSKWTFNLVTLRCEWFVYYGCPLNNGNIFNSRRDCESYCIRGIVNPCENAKCIPAYSLYQSDCFLVNDTACTSSILQQYSNIGSMAVRMDMAKEQILLFCQPPVARCINTGINVRLPTYESPPTYDDDLSESPPHCLLPPDRGSCQSGQRVSMTRVYYYSQRHNQCKFMMHFGCGGNLNRFVNQADCYNNCGI